MISRKNVCATIDAADGAFQRCWRTLADMKERRLDDAWRQRFANFQEDLARALMKLDQHYRQLAAEREATILRKHRLRSDHFVHRMRTLAQYQEACREALFIGKSLGDTFAWFFYQRDHRYIQKHLQHEGNLHPPSGVGGAGELEFTKQFKYLDDHVVIYHGTTTFLRIGDVSFIYLPTLKLSAIGELKTKKLDDHTIEITLTILSDPELPNRMPSLRRARRSPRKRMQMPPVFEQRFRRQMIKMNELLNVKPPERTIQARGVSNIHMLSPLLADLTTAELKHKKVDDGLLIVGIRGCRRGTKLSSRLLPARNGDHSQLFDPVTDIAMQIVDPSTTGNSMRISRIRTAYVPGTTPIFWAPIRASRLKQLVFHESMVWTWFNPVHLVRKLTERGFEVETDSGGAPIRLRKRFGRRVAIMHGVDRFLVLITQHLYTEDGFVSLIEEMITEMKDARMPPNAGIYAPLTQFYGEPPPAPDAHGRPGRSAPPGKPK